MVYIKGQQCIDPSLGQIPSRVVSTQTQQQQQQSQQQQSQMQQQQQQQAPSSNVADGKY